jgi:hypothetical protein
MRYRDFLRRRYRAMLAYTGAILALMGLLYLLPLALVAVYPAEAHCAGALPQQACRWRWSGWRCGAPCARPSRSA